MTLTGKYAVPVTLAGASSIPKGVVVTISAKALADQSSTASALDLRRGHTATIGKVSTDLAKGQTLIMDSMGTQTTFVIVSGSVNDCDPLDFRCRWPDICKVIICGKVTKE